MKKIQLYLVFFFVSFFYTQIINSAEIEIFAANKILKKKIIIKIFFFISLIFL